MAPFKEERGESPKVTRHTLGTFAFQLGDGGTVSTTIIHEITYVPPEKGQTVHRMVETHGRRGDRRTRGDQIDWLEGLEDEDDSFKEAQAKTPTPSPAQQEERCVNPGLYGSRQIFSTDSDQPGAPSEWAPSRPLDKLHSKSLRELGIPLPRSSVLSKTDKPPSRRLREALFQTSRIPDTDSAESSESSSYKLQKDPSQTKISGPTRLSRPVSSSSESTTSETPSESATPTSTRRKSGKAQVTHGSGGGLGESRVSPKSPRQEDSPGRSHPRTPRSRA